MAQAPGHNAYLPGHAPTHIRHHEWRTAENSAAYLLPVIQSKVVDNPHITLLDVGAGPGTISASLASYMPRGEITATDLSEDVLRRAAAHAEAIGVHNIKFRTANIYELPFADATFDVVHAHQVLCHLDSPVQAVTEMMRVTKPGGVVASRESDLRMWSIWPELPGIAKMHKMVMATMDAAGGSSSGGPQLISWAMKAGAKRKQITASMGTWCYSTPEERQMWAGTMVERIRNGEMRKKALQMGIFSEEDLEEMARDWEVWIVTEDACFGCMHGEVLVHK